MKIGVISDTHNILKEEVVNYLQDCDYIIHAGDVCQQEIIDQLNQIAKTFVVAGNNDHIDGLPHDLEVELGDILIYIVHDKKDIPKNTTKNKIKETISKKGILSFLFILIPP